MKYLHHASNEIIGIHIPDASIDLGKLREYLLAAHAGFVKDPSDDGAAVVAYVDGIIMADIVAATVVF